ncbi:hypothetical protein [Streptomyces sp. CB01881]|uniref:hypothetical protein n=1 Tax=Streptomyces sp. CB01881 TaxID=2078691 RepID=UPI00129CD1DA|nr:hypothetical protein [Streptomyces sp. CB01881]
MMPLHERLRREAHACKGDDDRPLAGCTGLMGYPNGSWADASLSIQLCRRQEA